MKVVKDTLGMSTDQGQSWKGIFYLVLTGVMAMPDGTWKHSLLIFWGLIMAWISWLTRGNIPPDKADYINDSLDPVDLSRERIDDVIQRGRK